MKTNSLLKYILVLLPALTGCVSMDSGAFDHNALKASSNIPPESMVEELRIPYTSANPRYMMIIEEVNSCNSAGGCGQAGVTEAYREAQLGAQLVSSMAKVGNFSIVQSSAVKRRADGSYDVKLRKGEVGPFVVRAMVTEFNEATEDKVKSGGSLGPVGIAMGIVGAITGKAGLLWPGVGLAALNPGMDYERNERVGIVGLDMHIYDGRSMRLVDAFDAKGSFRSKSEKSSFQFLWDNNSREQFGQSVLGQAMRVALQEASKKSYAALNEHIE